MRALLRPALVLLAAIVLPATPAPARAWEPDVTAAKAFAATRTGHVAFSLRVGDRIHGHRSATAVPGASLVKTMLLAAYLRRPSVRRRALRAADRALLDPMIRRSDDVAASRVGVRVGDRGLSAVARGIGMRDFAGHPDWGSSTTSARDQALLFWRLERVVPARHLPYAMRLLRTVVAGQRWGIAEAAPPGWRLFFKGGWGSARGLVDHQAALLSRADGRRIALAITTTGNRDHADGKATLRGVARRLLRGLRGLPARP